MARNNLIKNQRASKRRAELNFLKKKAGARAVEMTADEETCLNCEMFIYCGRQNSPKPEEVDETGNPVCYSMPEGIYDSVNK